MKRIVYFILVLICVFPLFAQTRIGTVTDGTITQLGMTGQKLVYTYYEVVEGFFYPEYLHWIQVGSEKIGPYDFATVFGFSSDGKALSYQMEDYDGVYTMIWMDGKQYVGSIIENGIIYVDGNQILKK